MLITLFLSATLLLTVFNLSLQNKPEYTAENFYQLEEIIHEKVEEKQKEEVSKNKSIKTNQAYNKASRPKHFSRAFKPIAPPEDFIAEAKPEETTEKDKKEKKEKKEKNSNSKKRTLDNKHLTAYNSVNTILSRKSESIKASKSNSANTNSSIYYSLKNRTHDYLPIPIYLCETDGKVVVNIAVNAYGKVTKASINSSSTTLNECLTDHALEYAKEARFNGAKKNSQIGTITFIFKGK